MIKNIDIYISSIYIHLLKSAEMIENEYANGNNMTGGFLLVSVWRRGVLCCETDGKGDSGDDY